MPENNEIAPKFVKVIQLASFFPDSAINGYAHILRYLRNDAALGYVKNYQSLRLHSGSSLLHSIPPRKSYKPHMLRNYSPLATFSSLTVKANVHWVTRGQHRKHNVRTHVRQTEVAVKLNWAFMVIYGYITKIQQRENCKFVDINHPAAVWRQFSEKKPSNIY